MNDKHFCNFTAPKKTFALDEIVEKWKFAEKAKSFQGVRKSFAIENFY